MFDFGWDEMALIGVISLIVIGPKDLPKVMREAGRWVRRAREMAAEFQQGLEEMTRESEVHNFKRDVEEALDTHSIRAEIEEAVKIEPPDIAGTIKNEPPPATPPEQALPETGSETGPETGPAGPSLDLDPTHHIPPSP